ncbi:MAG: LlaJI family restriction endonuclease [Bacteroidales bacterium]|nr:LlaJI family restriction endonuclease [Bacteroidales bacterium]
MKILIEEYRYDASLVRRYLHDIDELDVVEGLVSVSYVGYFYNNSHDVNDCVFILPKVLIDENNKVFGKCTPEEIIDLEKTDKLTEEERKFIYEFAVWIYRAIAVFKNSQKDPSIVRQKQVVKVGKGKRRLSNTYLDILLSLIQFNKENQDFFMFILKNIHSGFNKINWSRTLSRSSVVVQNDEPIYINPVNKKRQINFDEELLVIYFSILNYISNKFGFSVSINCNYDLIKGKRFEHYLEKFGLIRLRQIKYKYFSDKALQLWELCYAFFEQSHQVRVSSSINEYLLVKNFNIVFEAIIDELVGDKQLPDDLNKKQEDGKIVDHLFMWNSLTTADSSKKVYYIGDSKYYKIGNNIEGKSVAKQYTYARNVIQWNLNLFLDNKEKSLSQDHYKLRDDVTEGYDIVPNFFISAKIDEKLSYIDTIDKTDREKRQYFQRQFDNRLFDRDTLLISHYDVNFLFVVSLYARNNMSKKQAWKTKVRNIFRDDIKKILNEKYDFYAMKAKENKNGEEIIRKNFKDIIGKVYTPFDDKQIYSLALDKQFEEENKKVLNLLNSDFDIQKCEIGQNPSNIFN